MGLLDKSVVGKHVIIGITHLEHDGTFIMQEQLHGVIESLGDDHNLTIRLSTGEPYKLPADDRAFQPAPPGVYRFRTTGEEVENPDLMATWNVYKPKPDSG